MTSIPNIQPDNGVTPRRMGFGLIIGIIILPWLFCWFLLRDGHSKNDRVFGFGYMFLTCILPFIVILSIAPHLPKTKSKIATAPIAEPAPTETPAVPKADVKPESEYIELLQSAAEDSGGDTFTRDEGDPKATWVTGLGTIGAMATIYNEGAKYTLSDKGRAEQRSYLRKVGSNQAKAFPKLRALYGKDLGARLWEHDVKVTITGSGNSTLRLTGFWFAANRNIKQIFESAEPDALALRFKRIEFRSHDYDSTTYYNLSALPDTRIATFSNNSWSSVSEP